MGQIVNILLLTLLIGILFYIMKVCNYLISLMLYFFIKRFKSVNWIISSASILAYIMAMATMLSCVQINIYFLQKYNLSVYGGYEGTSSLTTLLILFLGLCTVTPGKNKAKKKLDILSDPLND